MSCEMGNITSAPSLVRIELARMPILRI